MSDAPATGTLDDPITACRSLQGMYFKLCLSPKGDLRELADEADKRIRPLVTSAVVSDQAEKKRRYMASEAALGLAHEWARLVRIELVDGEARLDQAWANFKHVVDSPPPQVFDDMSAAVGRAWMEQLHRAEEALHEAQRYARLAASPKTIKDWSHDTRMDIEVVNDEDWGVVRSALFLGGRGEAGVATIRLQYRVLCDDRERARATRWLKVSQYANAVALCEKMCEVT
jgi:hypothetical protein